MPTFENKPDPPKHEHKHHEPKDKPQDEKTAGDLRAEDAAGEAEDVTAQKQGVQDEANVVAMEQYKKEQLAEHPPESDPLKDREARRADDKKHDHGAAQAANDEKKTLAEDKAAQKHKP